MHPTTLFVWGFVGHVGADWLLQNEWMALNKVKLSHPAAWVHSGIHLLAMLLVFSPLAALLIACTHIAIDTRTPIQIWRRWVQQTTSGDIMIPLAMWQDQAWHIVILAAVALLFGA